MSMNLTMGDRDTESLVKTMGTLVAPIPVESHGLALEDKFEKNEKRPAPKAGGCRIEGFVHVKKLQIKDRIEQITQRLQQTGEEIINTSQVYFEAVGGRDNCQRIYSLGYGAGFYPLQRREASSSSQTGGSSSTAPAQPSLHQLYEHILQLESTKQQLLVDRERDLKEG